MPTPKTRSSRRATASLLVVVALLATACSPALQARLRNGAAATSQPTSTEGRIINAVNGFRAAHGLSALHVHPNLETKARTWAKWMADGHCGRTAQGYPAICHSNLASGITVHWSRLEENVGMASPASAVSAVTSGFEHSPEHAANMLNKQIADIGVGVAYSGNLIYVAEEFMAP
jgi:uncharacterized protein YkwD